MTASSAIAALLDTAPVQRLFTATKAAGGEARLVGGCVRDCLSGVPVGDLDMASTLAPEANLAMADSTGLKAATVPNPPMIPSPRKEATMGGMGRAAIQPPSTS